MPMSYCWHFCVEECFQVKYQQSDLKTLVSIKILAIGSKTSTLNGYYSGFSDFTRSLCHHECHRWEWRKMIVHRSSPFVDSMILRECRTVCRDDCWVGYFDVIVHACPCASQIWGPSVIVGGNKSSVTPIPEHWREVGGSPLGIHPMKFLPKLFKFTRLRYGLHQGWNG